MKEHNKPLNPHTSNPNRNVAIRTLSLGTLLIVISMMLSGCNSNMDDLATFVAETKAKYVGQVEALPIITPYETHRYQVENIRDPFRSSISLVKSITREKRKNNGVRPSSVRNKEELEKYPLDSLVMVGIMNNNGQNWAIIKTPDSNIFRVRKGNYIGENNGKILRISESKITLKEIVADGLGGWAERKNNVALSN